MSDKYVKVSEIDHILLRPDMYIGSVFNEQITKFVYNNILKEEAIIFNYGLYKIFDEIITNSVDEHIRNSDLNSINVVVKKDFISIKDNGGINIDFLNKYSCYTPELIFGKLRSGSNFNDSEKRTVAGNFGLGCKLTNVYSLKFVVEIVFNGKSYKQTWTNNMQKKTKPIIKDSHLKNYTKITFYPDFKRFQTIDISTDMAFVMKKRCLDLSGLNRKLNMIFNDDHFKLKTFKDYCLLYDNTDEENFFMASSNTWDIGITYSDNGFKQVSFVNGVSTAEGGTHVEYILNQIVDFLRPFFLKKHKLDIKPYEIRNNLFLFINATVINNRFSSQTKEKLTTDQKKFGTEFKISNAILNKLIKSEIVQRILDWKQTKMQIAEKVELRKLNKQVGKLKVPNLIDCSSKDRSKNSCEIFIFEGMSASNGFLKFRNTKTQAAYLLKGKILNTFGIKANKILQNKELAGLISSLGLILGNDDISNFRYDRVLITTDMDCLSNDTIVRCLNEDKFIRDVNQGDLVLTHSGEYEEVLNKKEVCPEHFIEIKVNGNLIKCSENHKFIVLRDLEILIVKAKDLKYTDFFLLKNEK